MASNVFNTYNGDGSYSTTYNKIKTLDADTSNSLVFDNKRHSIWTHGEEYGYSRSISISSSGTGNFVNGVSISNDNNAYTITVSKGYAVDTLSGTKSSGQDLVSDITKSNGTITITYTKSSSLSVNHANTADDADTLDSKDSSYFAHAISLSGDISGSGTSSDTNISIATTHYIPSSPTPRTGSGATSFIASNNINDSNPHYLRDGISILNGLKLDSKRHVVGTYEFTLKETYITEFKNENDGGGRKLSILTNYNDSYTSTIPPMTSTSYGVAKLGYVNSVKKYKTEITSTGDLFTYVPWINSYIYKAEVTSNDNAGDKVTLTYYVHNGDDSLTSNKTITFTIPVMTSSTYGVGKTGFTTNTTDRNYKLDISNGNLYTNVPWTDTYVSGASFSGNTSGVNGVRMTLSRSGTLTTSVTGDIPVMTNSVYGVAKAYHSASNAVNVNDAQTTSGKYYGIQTNPDGKLIVNVPWTDVSTSLQGHYTPEENSSAELNVDASGGSDATFGTTQIVTGVNIKRDLKGHVTGITVDSYKLPSLTTTYPTIETKNTNQSYNFLFTDQTSGSLAKSYVNNGLTFNPAGNTLSFSGGGLISTGDYNGNINHDDDILYLEGGANGINIYGNSAPIEIKSDDYNIDVDAGNGDIHLYSTSTYIGEGSVDVPGPGIPYNTYTKISTEGLFTYIKRSTSEATNLLFAVNTYNWGSRNSLNNPTINLGFMSSNYIRITGKVNRQSENTTYTNNIVTHTTSESNYIDQITVASSPGSDQHTLYIIT
jgi:hypothetical protein